MIAALAEILLFLLVFGSISGVLAYLGWYIISLQYDTFAEWFRLRSTPTIEINAAAVGRVDLTGQLYPVGDTVDAPFTGRTSAFAYWEIVEESSDSTETVASGFVGDRLKLTDETGSILIEDPAHPFQHEPPEELPSPSINATESSGSLRADRREEWISFSSEDSQGNRHHCEINVTPDRKTTITVPANERPDEDILLFCEQRDIEATSTSKRTYQEIPFFEGETAYLHGEAVPLEADSVDGIDLLVTGDSARQKFLLANRQEDELVDALWWRWKSAFVFGAFLILMGVVVLAIAVVMLFVL